MALLNDIPYNPKWRNFMNLLSFWRTEDFQVYRSTPKTKISLWNNVLQISNDILDMLMSTGSWILLLGSQINKNIQFE